MAGNFGFLVFGLVILVISADKLIEGASALAKRFGISDLVVGLTVIAFGTSMPELVVNVSASIKGSHSLVLGNVIGSNTFNLFIILGLAGLIRPMNVASSTVWKEIPLSFLAVILVLLFALIGEVATTINRFEASVLVLFFLVFMGYVFSQLKQESSIAEDSGKPRLHAFKITIYIFGGLVGLFTGGELVVEHARILAETWGWSEKIIGLTIVAAGTSLPELVTSLMAAYRGNTDIAIGNVVGSNIFNLLLILPVSALISPIVYDLSFNKDLIFLGLGTFLLFIAMFTFTQKKLDRVEAGALLISYVGYVVFFVL